MFIRFLWMVLKNGSSSISASLGRSDQSWETGPIVLCCFVSHRVSPFKCYITSSDKNPWHSIWYSGILSDIYFDIHSGILLWNSLWRSFWHSTSIWHLFWHSVRHSFWHSGPGVPHSIWSWRYGVRKEDWSSGGWRKEGVAPLLKSRLSHGRGKKLSRKSPNRWTEAVAPWPISVHARTMGTAASPGCSPWRVEFHFKVVLRTKKNVKQPKFRDYLAKSGQFHPINSGSFWHIGFLNGFIGFVPFTHLGHQLEAVGAHDEAIGGIQKEIQIRWPRGWKSGRDGERWRAKNMALKKWGLRLQIDNHECIYLYIYMYIQFNRILYHCHIKSYHIILHYIHIYR